MKIEISEQDNEKRITTYPNIGISKYTGAIVLFHAECRGTVLRPGGSHRVGDYSKEWAMDSFEVFTGTVTLQGEV